MSLRSRLVCLACALLIAACKGQHTAHDSDAGANDAMAPREEEDAGSDAATPTQPDASEAPQALTGELLFDEDAPIWHFDLEIAENDLRWLNEHALDEQYVPGNLTFQDQHFEQIAVRYKGGFGSLQGCFDAQGNLTCSKLSLKVSFNETDKSGRFLGLRKLVFHACNRDRTCLRERVSYGLFRDMDVQTCRTGHATVSINGGPKQLYSLIEYIDKEFLEDHFPDPEGNLYKERWPVVPIDSYYVDGLETNETTADVSHMLSFAQVLTSTDLSSYDVNVGPFLDLEQMGRYTAVDQLINNWDGIWKFYCGSPELCGNHNYFVYDDPASERFVIIPWDTDHTFTEPNPDLGRAFLDNGPSACDVTPINVPGIENAGIRNPQCDPLMRGVYQGAGWERYRKAMRTLLQGERTNREAVLARLNGYRARVRETVPADPSALSLAEWDAAVAQLRQIIIAQYAAAESLVAAP
jgi:spore coat protein H